MSSYSSTRCGIGRSTIFTPDLANAVAVAEAKGWQWKLKTLFEAVRLPYM